MRRAVTLKRFRRGRAVVDCGARRGASGVLTSLSVSSARDAGRLRALNAGRLGVVAEVEKCQALAGAGENRFASLRRFWVVWS